MADHKHVRPWHEALAKSGAQAPFDLDIRTPVQAVVNLEDFSKLFKPVPYMQVSGGLTRAGDVGRSSIPVEWEILSPGGAWITHWTANANAILYASDATRIELLDGEIVLVPWSVKGIAGVFDPPVLSVARAGLSGTGINVLQPEDGLMANTFFTSPNSPDIYVPFGKFVGAGSAGVGLQLGATIMIREIPTGFTP